MSNGKEKFLEFVNHLKKGGLVIYPTETAYAIGCDATNQKAVDLVFKIKKRSQNKTLPLIAGNLETIKKYCQMSKKEKQMAKKYWPGPLTLILRILNIKDIKLARGIEAKDGTVAIRVSSHRVAQELSRRLGRPIVSTSANLSGKGEYYSIKEVEKNFGCHPERSEGSFILLDGGKLKKKKPSTIVRVMADNTIKVLRQGEIRIES